MSTHTPGPWNYGNDFISSGGNNLRIAYICPTDEPEQEKANARLIVKSVNVAPKLAEALRVCERVLKTPHGERNKPAGTSEGTALRTIAAALAEWDAQ